jgi:hypothetical protein
MEAPGELVMGDIFMAIQCKYCGTDLPKEDARFCNNCGMLVPSHPFSHESLSASKKGEQVSLAPLAPSSGEPQERHKHVLREQVAELSPIRSKREHSEPDEPAKKPETYEQKPLVPDNLPSNPLPQDLAVVEDMPQEKLPDTPQPGIDNDGSSHVEEAPKQLSPSLAPPRQARVKRWMPGPVQAVATPAWPAPVTHVSVKEPSAPARRSDAQKKMAHISTSSNDEAASAREVHANVEDEEIREHADVEESAIEDLPTRALAVPVEDAVNKPVEDVPTQTVNKPVEDVPTQTVNTPVEDLPTRSMPVSVEKQSRVQEQPVEKVPSNPFLSIPATQSEARENFVEDWLVRANPASSDFANPALSTAFQPHAAPLVSSPDYLNVSNSSRQAESAASIPPMRRPRRRWPIIVVLLVVLILGGVGALGAMMLLSQQSSNDPVIQAQVDFSDPQLGISLLYPNGWLKQVDAGKSTAHFYASNHIGEVDIMVTTSSGTVKQALQQQATKMGMSTVKAGVTLTFAGASWQQLQGTVQQSGASYTDTLLATLHGGQLFMIVQQAPQNNYADWEKEFFVPLRSSFKFL